MLWALIFSQGCRLYAPRINLVFWDDYVQVPGNKSPEGRHRRRFSFVEKRVEGSKAE